MCQVIVEVWRSSRLHHYGISVLMGFTFLVGEKAVKN